MEVLSSRVIIHPADPIASRRFYREVLGLAVYREFGDPHDPGVVFFLGSGHLELSGRAAHPVAGTTLWLQVRDLAAQQQVLAAAAVSITRGPSLEPWGLWEMWVRDPDGNAIVLVEVPADHPLRRDQR